MRYCCQHNFAKGIMWGLGLGLGYRLGEPRILDKNSDVTFRGENTL